MADVIICWIAPKRVEDSSVGGVSKEAPCPTDTVGVFANPGDVGSVGLGTGVREVSETTCRAWSVALGISPVFRLPWVLWELP
ncbi:UNVERIFIED_CONTAM: hypothetical protein Sradi_6415700 [Sesamum radiatum]|uniref:Uncharacterized protein n=1 Tax=Sesamum radiatum TaxID=300843 RepID=A0AAW2K489_SESRA